MQPEMASLIFAMVQLVSCMVPTFFLDKVGRKPVLIVTLFIIALGMVSLFQFIFQSVVGWRSKADASSPFK